MTRAMIDEVRATYDALTAGDRERFEAIVERIMHPECEWTPFLVGVDGRTYRGHAGMLEFFDDFVGTFAPSYQIDVLQPVGEEGILVLGAMNLRGRGSGVAVTHELGVFFELEDGLIVRGRATDHATATAAAQATGAGHGA